MKLALKFDALKDFHVEVEVFLVKRLAHKRVFGTLRPFEHWIFTVQRKEKQLEVFPV